VANKAKENLISVNLFLNISASLAAKRKGYCLRKIATAIKEGEV